MPTVAEKYHLDLSDVHRLEAIFGARLPDLLEPLRRIDADLDTLREQAEEYSTIARDIETLHAELSLARLSYAWYGEEAESADGFWDVVLTVLKWIAAIILFIVGILLLLIGGLLVAIGAICDNDRQDSRHRGGRRDRHRHRHRVDVLGGLIHEHHRAA